MICQPLLSCYLWEIPRVCVKTMRITKRNANIKNYLHNKFVVPVSTASDSDLRRKDKRLTAYVIPFLVCFSECPVF